MPVIVGEAIIAAAEYIGAGAVVAGVSAATIGTIALTVASVAYSAYESSQARAKARAAAAASAAALSDRTTTIRESVVSARMVLGRIRVGGAIVYAASTGQNLETLVMVVAFASHECEAIEQFYFNDQPIGIDGTGYVITAPFALGENYTHQIDGDADGVTTLAETPIPGSVHVTTNDGSAAPTFVVQGNIVTTASVPAAGYVISWQGTGTNQKARLLPHLGGADQYCDAVLNGLLPTQWDASHIGNGICYVTAVFNYDTNSFQGGQAPSISAVIRGAKVFDPRSNTTYWSENPALLMRYYATHALGARLPVDHIDDNQIIAAANVCDTTIDYSVTAAPDGTPESIDNPSPGPMFRAGLLATCDQQPKDVMDALAQSMGALWSCARDKLFLKAASYVTPVIELTDDSFSDLADVQLQTATPTAQLFNIVTGTFSDPNNGWQATDVPEVRADDYVTADGEELTTDITWSAVPHVGQCQQLAAIKIRQGHEALTLTSNFNWDAYRVDLYDTIKLTNSFFGWNQKVFEVLGRQFTFNSLIQLTLRETSPTVYEQGEAFDTTYQADNTLLPSPWNIAQITGVQANSDILTLGDGTNQTRMRVQWDAVQDDAVRQGGYIETQFADVTNLPPDGQDWPSDTQPGGATETIIPGLKAGVRYLVRVRAQNGSGIRGPWSVQTLEQIAEPPAAGNVSYVGDPPAGVTPKIGDTKFEDNKQYRWDGTQWVLVVDGSDTGTTTPPDLTPPPTPTGFTGQAGVSNLVLQWNAATYTVGNGPGQTNIYAVNWPSGTAAPTFASAQRIMSINGANNIAAPAVTPGTRWCVWITFQSVDSVKAHSTVESLPAGGTNGLQLTTAYDPTVLVPALQGQILRSSLYADLGTQIDKIPTITADFTVPGSIAYQVLQEANARLAAVATLGASITTEQTVRQSSDSALASSINTLQASVAAGAGLALNLDPQCSTLADWTITGSVSEVTVSDGASGTTAFQADGQAVISSALIPMGVARTIYASARARTTTGTGTLYLRAHCFDSSGTLLAYFLSPARENITLTGSWQTFDGSIVTPTGTVNVELVLTLNNTEATGNRTQIQDCRLEDHTALNAAIQTEATARADADSALASQITTIGASTASNAAAIVTEQTARVTADSALATQINTVAASAASNLAAITSEQTARANADASLASSIQTILATTNANQGAALNLDPTCADPSQWEVMGSVTELSLTDGHSGSSAFSFNGAAQISSHLIPVSAGRVLQASVWARQIADGGLFYLRIYFFTASDEATVVQPYSTGNEGLDIDGNWYHAVGSLTVPTGCVWARLVIIANNGGSGTTHVQEATLQDISGYTAAIQTEATARASADSALATQITTVAASAATNAASIVTEQSARVSADGALATQINTVAATTNAKQAGVLNLDPACADPTQWEVTAGGISEITLNDGKSGTTGFSLNGSTQVQSHLLACTEGHIYQASTWIRQTAGSGGFYFRLYFFTATDLTNQIAYSLGIENVSLGAGWHHYGPTVTAPTGATFMRLVVLGNWTGTGFSQLQDCRVEDVTGYTAAIQTEATARADADGALSTLITTVQSIANGNVAAISTEATTRANADTTLSNLITTVQSVANGAAASVASEASTRAAADGSLFAQYTVKLDVNGYVSGYGLASTGGTATPQSSFIIRADSFAIAAPSGPGITPLVPFIVRTTSTTENGVSIPPGVYIDAAYIVNLTASYAKFSNLVSGTISTAALSAAQLTAGDGTIGGTLKSADYTGTGGPGWAFFRTGGLYVRGDVQATSVTTNSIYTQSINEGAVTKTYPNDTDGPDVSQTFAVGSDALGSDGTCRVWIQGITTTPSSVTTATQKLQLFSGTSTSGTPIKDDAQNDIGVVVIARLYKLGAGTYTARSVTDAGGGHSASVYIELLQR